MEDEEKSLAPRTNVVPVDEFRPEVGKRQLYDVTVIPSWIRFGFHIDVEAKIADYLIPEGVEVKFYWREDTGEAPRGRDLAPTLWCQVSCWTTPWRDGKPDLHELRVHDLPFFPAKKSVLPDGTKYRGMFIGGNSVKFDFGVIEQFCPKTVANMDYRVIDISSLGELQRRWKREARNAMPAKASDHTAMTDIREGIKELRYYRETGLTAAASR